MSIQQPMENSEFSKPPATLDELIGRLPRSFTEAEIQMIRNAYDLAAEAHAAVPREIRRALHHPSFSRGRHSG